MDRLLNDDVCLQSLKLMEDHVTQIISLFYWRISLRFVLLGEMSTRTEQKRNIQFCSSIEIQISRINYGLSLIKYDTEALLSCLSPRIRRRVKTWSICRWFCFCNTLKKFVTDRSLDGSASMLINQHVTDHRPDTRGTCPFVRSFDWLPLEKQTNKSNSKWSDNDNEERINITHSCRICLSMIWASVDQSNEEEVWFITIKCFFWSSNRWRVLIQSRTSVWHRTDAWYWTNTATIRIKLYDLFSP